MSKVKVLRSPAEPSSRSRPVTRPAVNRARVSKSVEPVRAKQELKRTVSKTREPVRDASADGSCSSDSSSSLSSVKTGDFSGRRRQNVAKPAKVVPDGDDTPEMLAVPPLVLVKKRCPWITPNSDPLYVSFHDEEWGVPIHDDRKLFEILIFSIALAELSWPTILSQREAFREHFDNFDPAAVAAFSDQKILSIKSSSKSLLSDLKLRAIVENARQMVKINEEFSSFNCYCWTFVNHKPIVNGFRYPHQVPVKTPKAEAISKDLIRRGFQCVGPTVFYSFMQAAGLVNGHLSSCFRYKECSNSNNGGCKIGVEGSVTLAKVMDNACSLQDSSC